MKKEYIVTTIDKVRTTYIVSANDEDEARKIIEGGMGESYEMDTQEFYDLDKVESVEENL